MNAHTREVKTGDTVAAGRNHQSSLLVLLIHATKLIGPDKEWSCGLNFKAQLLRRKR